jgi:hypothetical protein
VSQLSKERGSERVELKGVGCGGGVSHGDRSRRRRDCLQVRGMGRGPISGRAQARWREDKASGLHGTEAPMYSTFLSRNSR